MNKSKLGASGLEVSAIGLGTWAIGGGSWWGDTDETEAIATIHAALDAGITLIDTAPAYNWGHSEEIVGRALAGRRSSAIISTKCGLWWDDEQGSLFFELEGKKVYRTLKPSTIRKELECSLARLRTDYIDIYHTHWQEVPSDATPIAETMGELQRLKEEGLIRSIAVSNATVEQMREYATVGQLDGNQARYSMLDRSIEEEQVSFCVNNGIGILAYSPLEQGLLSGRIGMDREFTEQEYRSSIPWFAPDNRKRVLQMLEGWSGLTEQYACTLSQLVLSWTLSQPGISGVLVGARKPQHVLENAEAGTLRLSAEDLMRMREDVEQLGEPTV